MPCHSVLEASIYTLGLYGKRMHGNKSLKLVEHNEVLQYQSDQFTAVMLNFNLWFAFSSVSGSVL